MHSCLYSGYVEHRRATPAVHRFRYSLSLAYLDLVELDELFARLPRWLCSQRSWSPLSFRRSDYLGDPAEPLAEAVRRLLVERGYSPPAGPIRLLTQFRQFGYVFNPVSFYYCFDSNERLERVIAEVSNTPWGERHWYVLEATSAGEFPLISKEFHVSPFMDLALQYRWHVSPPKDQLTLGIENVRDGKMFFDVELNLARRQEMTSGNLARMLVRYFLQPQRVMAGIYWQALWLWWKRVPYVPHPKNLVAPAADKTKSADPALIPTPDKIAT